MATAVPPHPLLLVLLSGQQGEQGGFLRPVPTEAGLQAPPSSASLLLSPGSRGDFKLCTSSWMR